MDRLQKKCFIVSAGMHVLLALILLVSSGFISSKSKTADITPLTFVPSMLLENDIRGGGNPKAPPPQPAAPPQMAAVQPKTQAEKPPPEPAKPPEPQVRHPVPTDESTEVASVSKPRLPAINTKLVTRSQRPTANKNSPTNDSDAEERRAAAEARREVASRIGRAVADLGQAASPVTSIEDFGPGGGGPAYAGYAAFVQAVYLNAWVPPEETGADAAVAHATITIARDGTVLSARITNRSGDSHVDSSVQRALDRVATIGRPFPESMKDKQRTYILKFDLTVKRGQA